MKKAILVILSGAADRGRSAYASAAKHYMNMFASNSSCGLWEGSITRDSKRSLSGIATLEIFGYSQADDPGRGYLEALGAGRIPARKSVCIHGNFASVKGTAITDSRAGRDHTGIDELVDYVNREIKSIGDVKVRLNKLAGHRIVLVLTGEGLSRNVSDAGAGKRAGNIKPLDSQARKTARILNSFVSKSSALLSPHEINKRRDVPANFILLRSAGAWKAVEKFPKRYGKRACVISGTGVVRGIAKYLGIDIIDSPLTELEEDLHARVRKAVDALDRYDFVVLHIKGADTFSHNKDFDGKVRFIEKVDREVFSMLSKLRSVNVAVVSDHITNSATGEHEPGPVPFMVYDSEEDGDDHERFDEASCRGSFVTDSPMKKIASVM